MKAARAPAARPRVAATTPVAGLVLALLLGACAGEPTASAPATSAPSPTSPGDPAAPTAPGATPTTATSTTPPTPTTTTTTTPEPVQLPRGGREIFPTYRLFGYSGAPGSPGLGRLGIGDLDERVEEMEKRGQPYRRGRELMPVLELIATVVHPVPGADGTYRTHIPDDVVQDHLDAARRHDGILLLNIQPGRADFLDEIRYWEKWLAEPDIGVALDPEWAVEPGQVPGEVYGRTNGAELDEVAEYLSGIVAEHHLPEKVMVYHQVHLSVVREEQDLEPHEGVVQIKSVDGIGHPRDKVGTYDRVIAARPEHVHAGFKLFYLEDAAVGPLMTPKEVMSLEPVPEYILFE